MAILVNLMTPNFLCVGGSSKAKSAVTNIITGQSGFLTFTDYVGLDTDILITV